MANSFQSYDDRPIGGSGQYDLTSIPYDEIEVMDNYSEVELASPDTSQIDRVKQAYYDILH
jgi:hypothetical protein